MTTPTTQCTLCGAQLATGQTLCKECRKTYIKQIAAIPQQMQVLTILAKKEAHIGPRAHGKSSRQSNDLIDWTAEKLRTQLAQWLQVTASNLTASWGLEPLDRWHLQWQRLAANITHLTTLPSAPRDAQTLTKLLDRVRRYTTPPANLILIGTCPHCTDGDRILIYADPTWTSSTCPQCHSILNLAEVRQAYINAMPEHLHITNTVSGVAAFLRQETGIKINAQKILNLRKRGHLHPIHVEGKYWQWPLKELYEVLNK